MILKHKLKQRGSYFDSNTSDGLLRVLAVLFPSMGDAEMISISKRFFPTRSVDGKVIGKILADMKALYSTRRGQFSMQLKKIHIEWPITGLEKHTAEPPRFKVSVELRDKVIKHCQQLAKVVGEDVQSADKKRDTA